MATLKNADGTLATAFHDADRTHGAIQSPFAHSEVTTERVRATKPVALRCRSAGAITVTAATETSQAGAEGTGWTG